jgi:hypothetical protein
VARDVTKGQAAASAPRLGQSLALPEPGA